MILESTYNLEKYREIGLAEKITLKAIAYTKEKKMKIKLTCTYVYSSKTIQYTKNF